MRDIINLIFTISLATSLCAQEGEHHETNNEKSIYEIITTGITSYSYHEEKWVQGVEFHFTYWFNHEFGSGLAYTAKFDDDITTADIALLGSWNPNKWLTLNAGPNFAFSSEEREFEIGAYFESEINIRPNKWFHFGPVIGTVFAKSSEFTLGLHLGFEIY